MTPAQHHPFILLVVIALIAGSWPAALIGGVGLDLQDDPYADPEVVCYEKEDACPEGEEETCPVGCDSCFLACCAGMVSLIPPVVMVASGDETTPFISQPHGDISTACARDIDHPPQIASL
jgi:hypothetical protein